MHHTQALKTLLQCLEDLTGTVDSFGREQNLHEVEKDLVLYKGRLLYEAILKLPTEAAKAPENRVEPEAALEMQASTDTPFAAPTRETNIEPDSAAVEPVVVEEDEVAADMPEFQPESEPLESLSEETAIPEIEVNRLTISIEKADEKTPNDKPEPRIASIQLERFSISEVLKLSGDKDLILTHLKLKPIQDLKSGIGLNEKFLFIRELFENDHQSYAQVVDTLNNSENLDQAEAYIAKELLPRYGWELDKEALLNFLHLILRRFSNK